MPYPQGGAALAGKGQRLPAAPADSVAWPWQAIGRVNIADRVQRRYCTGTLVGARIVLTAGHCVFDHRLGRWARPEQVHFVAGQARDTSAGHAVAAELVLPNGLDVERGIDPRLRTIRFDLMDRDWALLVLETALPIKPLPVRAIPAHAFAREVAAGEVVRAGYSPDRPYLLSVQRGCAATVSERWPAAMLNRCDLRPGDVGAPVLLLQGESAFVVGLTAAAGHEKRGSADLGTVGAFGPSAAAFADAVSRATARLEAAMREK